MSKKSAQRFVVLFAMLFLLAGSFLVLPDSQRAANLNDDCELCNAGCNDDYTECINMGIEKPYKCSQHRMACFNYCLTEVCN
jgi:hypothetical protein